MGVLIIPAVTETLKVKDFFLSFLQNLKHNIQYIAFAEMNLKYVGLQQGKYKTAWLMEILTAFKVVFKVGYWINGSLYFSRGVCSPLWIMVMGKLEYVYVHFWNCHP